MGNDRGAWYLSAEQLYCCLQFFGQRGMNLMLLLEFFYIVNVNPNWSIFSLEGRVVLGSQFRPV